MSSAIINILQIRKPSNKQKKNWNSSSLNTEPCETPAFTSKIESSLSSDFVLLKTYVAKGNFLVTLIVVIRSSLTNL
jgi:hypothetical protein